MLFVAMDVVFAVVATTTNTTTNKTALENTQTEFMAFTKCVGCINAVKLPILQLHQNNIYNVIIFKPCTLPSILALKMLTYTARTNIKCKDTNSKDENKSSDRFGP